MRISDWSSDVCSSDLQLALAARTRRLVDVQRLPVQVGRAPQCEIDGAAGDGGVGLAVDQDEAAQLAVVRIALEGDRPVQLEVATADLVARQLRRRQRSLRVDVDLVPDLRDRKSKSLNSSH